MGLLSLAWACGASFRRGVDRGHKVETSLTTHSHSSISPELMTASVQQANARIKIAEARWATPAAEKTRQVKVAGVSAGVAIAIGVLGAVIRPESATQISVMVGIVATIFAGAFAVGEWRKPSPRE